MTTQDDFFVLLPREASGDIFVTEYTAPETVEYAYSSGQPLTVDRPVRLFFTNGGRQRTDLIAGVHSFPVVSTRFRNVIVEGGVDRVEFHPAELIEAGGSAGESGYWVLNVLDNVVALDREQSNFEADEGVPDVIAAIFDLVLLPEPLRGRDLVRLAEMRSVLLASGRLRELVEAAGLVGVVFQPIDEFNSYETG